MQDPSTLPTVKIPAIPGNHPAPQRVLTTEDQTRNAHTQARPVHAFWTTMLPLCLLGALLVIMLATLVTQATSAGLTTDEGLRMNYGLSVYRWYRSLGQDQLFLAYPTDEYEPQHGVIFDTVVAGIVQIFHSDKWGTDAICIGITGILGVVAIALCGFELGGWWFAFLAALSLWLYPRYFGAIFNNPKDVPFTMASTFLLWSILLLMRQWAIPNKTLRNSLLVGFFLALAVAIRVNGILWYGILVLLLAGWWLVHFRETKRARKLFQKIEEHFNAFALIIIVSSLGIMLMWPYVFIDPLADLYRSVKIIAKYPWNGSVLYQGQIQLATNLPRSYAPVWLVIGSPPALILLSLLGFAFLCAWCARKKVLDPKMTVVTLAFGLPLASIVLLHSELYNALRQFLFLVPPMILLAIYGLTRLFALLWQRKNKLLFVLLIILTCVNFLWTAVDMLNIHPYEYIYFSPLVGGTQGAYGQYEMDYWNSCYRPASEWLSQNYQQYTASPQPTIQAGPFQFQYLTFLPTNFRAVKQNAAFYIDTGTFESPQQLAPYRLIHTVSIENVPLCRVYVRKP